MSKSLNKVTLIGHVGKDPEVRQTSAGKSVAGFSIATNEGPKDNPRTEWHSIIAWEKLADICGQWVKKGQRVYIEGRIQTREYEKDGQKKSKTEIVATDLILLDPPQQQPVEKPAPAPAVSAPQYRDMSDDDLPF